MRRTAQRDQFRAQPKRPGWINLTAIVSSLTAVGALIFTALSLQTTRQQITIDAQGQVTSRFTTAVNQLTSSNSIIQSGAIFALGSIAHDSAYWQPEIITLLSDFVREKAHGLGAPGASLVCDRKKNVPANVTAALIVLGGRDSAHDGWATVDLHHTCLDNAQLEDMNFRCANFDDASLYDASLDGARLDGAALDGTDLQSTGLTGAQLMDAKLDGAVLGGPPGEGALLGGADLNDADLGGADFANANLIKASLRNVGLDHTIFTDAYLNGAEVAPYPNVPTFMKVARTGRTEPAGRPAGECHVSPGQ